jgi:hypothetical protein
MPASIAPSPADRSDHGEQTDIGRHRRNGGQGQYQDDPEDLDDHHLSSPSFCALTGSFDIFTS